jgi:hypothetical protein
LHENYPRGKESASNHPNPLFKEKEKGVEGGSKAWWPMECSMFGGHWKVPSLVAIKKFHAWWPLECSMLGGHWNVPSLVAIGMFQAWWPLGGEGKMPFHLFHFPPTNLTYTFTFSLRPYGFTLPWS